MALQASRQFAEYIFIEKKRSFAKELEEMVQQEFSQQASRAKILNEDCNQALIDICQKVNWKNNRAVLFLDPYAADICWETLSAVAATEAIDVWYLFPFSAANRLMKKTGEIDPTWREKLNSIFRDNSWDTQFYEESPQMDLCYAHMMSKHFGKVKGYEEWTTPQIVENATELFEKELPRYRDKIQILHLCFTTDPFMQGHPEICQLSMEILRKANAAEAKCSILTKGILPA